MSQTKDYEIGTCYFLAKHATLRNKSKDWLACKQDNVNKNVKNIFFINVWRKSVFDIYFTEFGADLTTVLPVFVQVLL